MPFLIPITTQSIEGVNNLFMTASSTSLQQQIKLQQILSSSFSHNQITTIANNCYATPNKEDIICIHQGEEDRLVSSRKQNMDVFLSNVTKGKFSNNSYHLPS